MEQATTQARTPFSCDPATLADPAQGLALARALWGRGRREMSLDLYDQLAQAHPGQAVPILAEAFDRMQTIEPRTRYTLYQSRFFDFAIAPGDTVLDMGSGHMPFPLATHLADISLSDGTTGRAGAAFRHVDGKPAYEVRVEATGFADKQFDFVYCSHVLEHADDPAAACRELMRIARRGYIETPTKGKDALMGSARVSNHRWHVELLGRTLVFTEYEERDLAGFGVDILMNMHTSPQTDREKAFSALVWLRADQCNTMLAWDGGFDFQVRRPSVMMAQVPGDVTEAPLRTAAAEASVTQVPETMEERAPGAGKADVSVSVSAPESASGSAPAQPEAQPGARPLRLMQVHTFYPNYLHYFYSRRPDMAHAPYAEQARALHQDGFSAVHMLAEHLAPLGYEAELVVANNQAAQHAWAFEQGLDFRGRVPSPEDILLAQVEAFAPDVLYMSNPITFDSRFVRRLSRRPRLVLGWRAANIPESWDPTEFDLILSCLDGVRAKALEMGARDAAHFHPGFPDFLFQAVRDEQAVHDVAFCGQVNANQYRTRNARLHLLAEACAQGRFGLRMNLSGQLEAATPLTRAVNAGPCFGLDMYRALRSGRVVFDVRGDIGLVGPGGKAQDLAGRQTANMRIFEATGVGAFLLTEHFDNVEEYFQPGVEIETYADDAELLDKIAHYLKHEDQRQEIAARGLERCRKDHSMSRRVMDFDRLVRERLGAAPASTAGQAAHAPAAPPAAPTAAPTAAPPTAPKAPSTPGGALNTRPAPRSPAAQARQASQLAEKLTRLAGLAQTPGRIPAQAATPLLEGALRLAGELLDAGAHRAALDLVCAAKHLALPVRGLDLLRAKAFQGLGDASSTREALKEELRYFPDNAEARAALDALPAQAADEVPDAPGEFRELLGIVRPYTMLSVRRLHSLYRLARAACAEGLPGSFVECGVAAGGSSALLAGVLARHGGPGRWIYSFDTFEGMPAPDQRDRHGDKTADDIGWGRGTCAAPMDSLLEAARATGGADAVVPVKGLFGDTLPRLAPAIGPIALLHMDGDWYGSTMDILVNLYDQVVPGGLIQIDDYGFWQGCRDAVRDFTQARGLTLDVQAIDDTGVWLRKPA